jgi:hypothetical protein
MSNKIHAFGSFTEALHSLQEQVKISMAEARVKSWPHNQVLSLEFSVNGVHYVADSSGNVRQSR